jgi:hypothetical protein
MDTLRNFIGARKQLIQGLVVGLIIGPILSGIVGWQVRSSTARDMVRSAVVAQQVKVCEFRARIAVPDPAKLEWSARYDLARTWAKMPWQESADSDVVSGCSTGLDKSA